ncbi:MAG: hypothetical protein HRU15_04070 [Planctomycetes bacterium]|nr:hypothetical protein [Planctomycetota bacterium]
MCVMNEIKITQQQRLQITQCLEDVLDRQVERVDESSIEVFDEGKKSLSVQYHLIQSAGCAGPSRTHNIRGSVPRHILE